MPRGVRFQNAPFGHAHQNRLGPFRIFMETMLAGRATANLARVDKLKFPGFEENVNLTFIGVHAGKLPQPGGGVESHEAFRHSPSGSMTAYPPLKPSLTLRQN